MIFSHYDYFDQLIDAAVGKGEEHWATHQRVSYVWYAVPDFYGVELFKPLGRHKG